MAVWKLTRILFGNKNGDADDDSLTEEYTYKNGDIVTVGRGVNNTISLSSIVVSRNHCQIKVKEDYVVITDLKSSNGIYVGLKKISPNIPFSLEDSDIIGIGWTNGAPVANIKDSEKYVFKLTKEKPPPVTSRLTFQSDNEGDIENVLSTIDGNKQKLSLDHNKPSESRASPVLNCKLPLKRKIKNSFNSDEVKTEGSQKYKIDENIISILSDSENEVAPKHDTVSKKPKLDPNFENPAPITSEIDIKTEKEDLEYDAFKVKQEYFDYDEPIQVDSESDDESVNWLMRLSQSSPGKPVIKSIRESKVAYVENEESSYSQIDEFEEDFMDDLISIIPPNSSADSSKTSPDSGLGHKTSEQRTAFENEEEYLEDPISLQNSEHLPPKTNEEIHMDVVDGGSNTFLEVPKSSSTIPVVLTHKEATTSDNSNKKALVIEALARCPRVKSNTSHPENKIKTSSSSRHGKNKKHSKHSSSRRHITDSQKEERKRKLKDIATKEKEEYETKLSKHTNSSKEKGMVNAKVTSTNRGAFLTDVVQGVVKPKKGKDFPQEPNKIKEKLDQKSSNFVSKESTGEIDTKNKSVKSSSVVKEHADDIENKKRQSERHTSSKHKDKEKSGKEHKSHKHKEKADSSKVKSTSSKSQKSSSREIPPVKSLKPLSESKESFSGKPFSKVVPMPNGKPKKTVRFSDNVSVVEFEIEEGNNMKKTSMVKTTLVDVRQKPVLSLEKISLMRILRWNPQWLAEQVNNNDPPPILGTHHPMAVLHSFNNHNQYVRVVGDLLLIEIWECLTQGFKKVQNQPAGIEMRIASLPPVSSQDRRFELFNLSVNVSVPTSEVKTVPRMGEIILMTFGPETARCKRFFYVHNVRTLPSPPNNRNTFFCISLHSCYTEKMKSLKPGELMIGQSLAHIQKELTLFEAIEHMAGSPLSEAILKPEPRHFVKCDPNAVYPQSQWTKTLNPSQKLAVHSSVSAAFNERPSIQMVQGPPGTGKSSVICAMVMTYLFDEAGRRRPPRANGKILICATSNAAVDELVIRLLKIRQNQPKTGRFRMVRVGRAEAMHPRALDISSQQFAQRETAARQQEPAHPALNEEVSHLEAKINMWKTQEQEARDPVRAAYCKGQMKGLIERIAILQRGGGCASAAGAGGGGGGQAAAAQELAATERRFIEGADVIVTTLSSALNHKMRGLRRRIALCIVDEAGQAIEPETLIPLTLDVTNIALIGDPQQLPGFICSQRAKKLGLGESLFYRLSSCAEQWGEGSPVVLLNQQYRMQEDIADYPNRAFYGSLIRSVPPPRPNLDIPAYSIVSISSGDKGQDASGGNEMEAWGVARLVLALHAATKPLGLSLAVISPYNAHKELIKRNLKTLQEPSEGAIEVNTVDSFQGQERDVVVVSLARSQGVGFLTDTGRMNVMLTRAKHALCVCLNPHAMLRHYQWRTLIEDAQKRNLYKSLPIKICQGPSAGPIPHCDVLKHITKSQ